MEKIVRNGKVYTRERKGQLYRGSDGAVYDFSSGKPVNVTEQRRKSRKVRLIQKILQDVLPKGVEKKVNYIPSFLGREFYGNNGLVLKFFPPSDDKINISKPKKKKTTHKPKKKRKVSRPTAKKVPELNLDDLIAALNNTYQESNPALGTMKTYDSQPRPLAVEAPDVDLDAIRNVQKQRLLDRMFEKNELNRPQYYSNGGRLKKRKKSKIMLDI